MAIKPSKKRRQSQPRIRPVTQNCPFCKDKIEPDYKDYRSLEKYISDRAKILGKAKTGLCAKHQRRVAVAIKRARYLGLFLQ